LQAVFFGGRDIILHVFGRAALPRRPRIRAERQLRPKKRDDLGGAAAPPYQVRGRFLSRAPGLF
jgi:hypothetical protein